MHIANIDKLILHALVPQSLRGSQSGRFAYYNLRIIYPETRSDRIVQERLHFPERMDGW